MEMVRYVLWLSLVTVFSFPAPAGAYPARGGGDDSCSSCHDNKNFAGQVVFQLINKKTKENVVKGDTAYIPIKLGSSEAYKLILGSNGKTKEKAKTIGWMLSFPGGIKTELPNCIRLLNSGQKFRFKRKDKDGKIIEENDDLTVATQTFYFDGNVGNHTGQLKGEMRTSMGIGGKGAEGLGETVLKLVFVP